MQMEGQIQQLYNGTEHSIIPPSGLWHYIENLYYPAKAKKKKTQKQQKKRQNSWMFEFEQEMWP